SLGGRHVPRIGIEVVEHLIEEALNHPLAAGSTKGWRSAPRGGAKLGGRAAPGEGVLIRWQRARVKEPAPEGQEQALFADRDLKARIECGQPAQPPQRELRDG